MRGVCGSSECAWCSRAYINIARLAHVTTGRYQHHNLLQPPRPLSEAKFRARSMYHKVRSKHVVLSTAVYVFRTVYTSLHIDHSPATKLSFRPTLHLLLRSN